MFKTTITFILSDAYLLCTSIERITLATENSELTALCYLFGTEIPSLGCEQNETIRVECYSSQNRCNCLFGAHVCF